MQKLLIAAATAAALACGGSDGGGGEACTAANATITQQVTANGTTFSPACILVEVGEDVHWSSTDTMLHNVTFDARTGAPTNGDLPAGGNIQRTFTTAGTFPYQCTLHPGMRGTVIVQASVP